MPLCNLQYGHIHNTSMHETTQLKKENIVLEKVQKMGLSDAGVPFPGERLQNLRLFYLQGGKDN